jgi:hypothetical protein
MGGPGDRERGKRTDEGERGQDERVAVNMMGRLGHAGGRRRGLIRTVLISTLALLFFWGCTRAPVVIPPALPPPPAFPPQKVMESGDYAGFLAENQKGLEECGEKSLCEVPFFNLGFIYAYPKSPYYDPSKGLPYFEELIQKHPQSPWAFQATAWIEIMKKNLTSEDQRRRLQGEMKSKNAAINELKEQIKRSREIDLKIEQKERELLK